MSLQVVLRVAAVPATSEALRSQQGPKQCGTSCVEVLSQDAGDRLYGSEDRLFPLPLLCMRPMVAAGARAPHAAAGPAPAGHGLCRRGDRGEVGVRAAPWSGGVEWRAPDW